jgi:hypothetical protein
VFHTHSGQYEFRVMAFGLCGAPNTFQSAMNTTLAPLLRKCCLVFFDDILIYNPTLVAHVDHLQQVLQLLQKDHWQVKLTKCSFCRRKVDYLGHVISKRGVATDPLKIWLDMVQEGYAKDIQAQHLLAALTVAPQSMQHYTLTNGIIRYKNRVWIGNNSPL